MKKYPLKETTGGMHKNPETGNVIMKTLKGWNRWGKQFTKGEFNVIHVSLYEASNPMAFVGFDFVRVTISNSQTF